MQEKVKAGADLVALGKENGYEFSQEELNAGLKELQESDEELTQFELEVVSGGWWFGSSAEHGFADGGYWGIGGRKRTKSFAGSFEKRGGADGGTDGMSKMTNRNYS